MNEILHIINEMSPYLLLGFLLAGLMHAFIPGRYYTKYLSKKTFKSVINAAILGIPLPLCSCGVIPTAMSLRKEGASKGATTSFLIATPQTGVDSIIATYSLMGLPFALVRPIAALVTAVFGGVLANATDESVEVNVKDGGNGNCEIDGPNGQCETNGECRNPHSSFYTPHSSFNKILIALRYAYVEMMEDIGKWLILGLIVAGLITVFVPDEAFQIFEGNTFASMILVLCIAMPMYVCATGSIPIAVALMMKGLTPGAALVLLMAGPACNFASMLVVRKVLGTKSLIIYMISIVIGAIGFGCLIDYLQFNNIVNFLAQLKMEQACCAEPDSWFAWGCTALLCLLLINALVINKLSHNKKTNEISMDTQTYHIEGMSCNHCRMTAEKALESVPGVTSATVDLATKEALVTGTATEEDLRKAIDEVGFTLTK